MSAEGDRQAQELRAQGLTYREIAERLGWATAKGAWGACNRQRERELNATSRERNREHRREYDRRYMTKNRYLCPECGYVYGVGSGTKRGRKRQSPDQLTDTCPNCVARRRERVVGWWAEGLTYQQIANRLGWTINHVQVEIVWMREAGFDLPYRRAVYPNGKPKHPELARAA